MNYAVIWVDTNGLFSVHNCGSFEQAAHIEQIVTESGLPVLLFSSDEFIRSASLVRQVLEEEGPPEAYSCRCGGDPAHPRSERCGP